MNNILLERHDAILVATMNRGKANALSSAMMDEFLDLINQLENDKTLRTLVLTSANDNVFCAGFDVEEVFTFDRETMEDFLSRFVNVIEGLREVSQSVVVAISGHAYAGGALLALAGDLRLMSDTPLNFSIPEADLGVEMPLELTGWTAPIPHGVLRDMLLCANPLQPKRCLEIGLVSNIVPSNKLQTEAIALARKLANKAPSASAGIKTGLNVLAGGVMDSARRAEFVDGFASSWFSEESVARRKQLATSLGK